MTGIWHEAVDLMRARDEVVALRSEVERLAQEETHTAELEGDYVRSAALYQGEDLLTRVRHPGDLDVLDDEGLAEATADGGFHSHDTSAARRSLLSASPRAVRTSALRNARIDK